MQLPASLAPWRRYLNWFDAELAGLVGELLRRLQPLLGPALSAQRRGELLPDGIDDLRRRGSYERLLLSEWAVAEAEPDEFLRRAVTGEHLFLSPRLVRPRSQQRIVALFDSGPVQLGTPRLVQVALAILLARRAEELGAAFGWGCLQSRDAWQPLEQAEALRALLAQRSLLPADEASLVHWRGQIAALEVAPAECWLIGNGDALAEASHRVDLRRQFDGGVAVQIRSGRGRRELLLPAPTAAATRVLRGAFDVPKKVLDAPPGSTVAARFALSHAPLLDRCGRRVALPLLGSNGMLQVRLPTQAGAAPSIGEQHWRSGTSLLAALFFSGSLAGVVSVAGNLRGWNIKEFKSWPRPDMQDLVTAPGQGRWLRAALLKGQVSSRLLLLDHAGNLADWQRSLRSSRGPQLESLTRQVLALHQAAGDDAVIASLVQNQLLLARLNAAGASEVLARLPVTQPPAQAFLAGRMQGTDWIGCCAFASSGAPVWRLQHQRSGGSYSEDISPPAQVRIVGLCRDPQSPDDYVLLGLDAAAGRLRTCTTPPQELHAVAGAAAIRHVSVSADGARIALLTDARELLLIDAATREVLLRLRSGT